MTIKVSDIFPRMTPRQSEVCALLVKGLTDKHIARALGITPKTVNHYRCEVLQLAGAANTCGLAYRVMGSPEVTA